MGCDYVFEESVVHSCQGRQYKKVSTNTPLFNYPSIHVRFIYTGKLSHSAPTQPVWVQAQVPHEHIIVLLPWVISLVPEGKNQK